MEATQSFVKLLEVMDTLRAECPWDKKQTFETLRSLTIEETFELSEAIQNKDQNEIKKELGDVLLHIVFYCKMASEKEWFGIHDVMQSLIEKLIYRHPHIYGDIKAEDEATVKQNWEKIKLKEKGNKGVLDGVPNSLPSLIKAQRMQEKAAQVGFDWDNKEQVWAKVEEELLEFKQAKNKKEQQQELGDLLFAIVNYGRSAGINADDALEYTNRKFKNRFEYIEKKAKENNEELINLSLDQMDYYWEESKNWYK